MSFSKESVVVDGVIKETLDTCFKDKQNYMNETDACLLFRENLQNLVVYFQKVAIFKQAYDMRLAETRNASLRAIATSQPDFYRLSLLYLKLIKGTILDPETTSIRLEAEAAIGDVPPRLYVVMTLLACVSSRRTACDGMLMPVLAGRSSRGKSRILEPFSPIAKGIANEAKGVGRYEMESRHNCFLWSDLTYATLAARTELNLVKNILRAEHAEVKIRNRTQTVRPSYGLLSSNENLFEHKHPAKAGVIFPNYTAVKTLTAEHLKALKCRIIECYFMRQSPLVDPDVFFYNVSMEQARAELAALVLHEFKSLRHPLSPTSATLIPACLQGATVAADYAAPLLNISPQRMKDIITEYNAIYATQMAARGSFYQPSPIFYDDTAEGAAEVSESSKRARLEENA